MPPRWKEERTESEGPKKAPKEGVPLDIGGRRRILALLNLSTTLPERRTGKMETPGLDPNQQERSREESTTRPNTTKRKEEVKNPGMGNNVPLYLKSLTSGVCSTLRETSLRSMGLLLGKEKKQPYKEHKLFVTFWRTSLTNSTRNSI